MYSADLVRDRRFWKVAVASQNTAVISYGVIGSKGSSTSRSFPSAAEAEEWARAAAEVKEASGYGPMAHDGQTSNASDGTSKKRANEEESAPVSATKKLRRSSRKKSSANATDPVSTNEEMDDDLSLSSSVSLKSKKASVQRKPVKPGHTVVSAPPAVIPAPVAQKKTPKAKKGAKKGTKTDPGTEATASTVKPPVDSMFPNSQKAEVVDEYDATLNQTNINYNNNKYYRIQLLRLKNKTDQYVVWTRWGRVGEMHSHSTKQLGPFTELEKAIAVFEKKFYNKTANLWSCRANFFPWGKKYDLLEVDYTKKEDAHLDAFAALDALDAVNEDVEYLPPSVDAKTQDLVEMLFEKDMYADAMRQFDIDTRRMPLGQLTAAQIQRGIDVLQEIEDIQRYGDPSGDQLRALSSRFYSVIPHDFGRQCPPIIHTAAMLQNAFDKCNVLLDITHATKLMADAENRKTEKKEKKEKTVLPHPVDSQYKSLGADLSLVTPGSSEHAKVLHAFNETSCNPHGPRIVDVWRVDRNGEEERFSQFEKLSNHKLLWHGTNIAVVAAILSSGLRIMPHSGGRCGSGIYLASESGKSQGYTRANYKRKIGCMFLAEAALGREFSLFQDNGSLKKAPQKFDSVVARGWQTPPSFEKIALGANKVLLPTSQPVKVPAHSKSSFSQDEYLLYREEQVRLRYILTVKFRY